MFRGYLPLPVTKTLVILAIIAALSACSPTTDKPVMDILGANMFSPGAPGTEPTWAFAGKTGIGTSYTPYLNPKNNAEA